MEKNDLIKKNEEIRKSIEEKINGKVEKKFNVVVGYDQLIVTMADNDRFSFRAFVRTDIRGNFIKIEYNIPNWGSFSADDDLAQLFAAFGTIMADKDLLSYIDSSMREYNQMCLESI